MVLRKLAGLTVALIALIAPIAVTTTAQAAPTDGLVAWYPLTETSGTVAQDASGNGRHGAVEGAATWLEGNGFRFSGGGASSGNSIKLPDNITAGLESITVSLDVWVDPALSGNHFVYNLGNLAVGNPQSGTGYLFTTTSPYRATISNAAWSNEQVTSKGSNLARGAWKHLTYTQTGTVGTLFENGVQVAQKTNVAYTPAQIGNGVTTRNYLGKSAYAADNSFMGVVRDFRIYNRALATSEVAELTTESHTALVATDAAWVESALGDVSAVTSNLALPARGPARAGITWTSSNTAVIASNGTVSRPTDDTVVELTATVAIDGISQTRVIPVTVKGVPNPDLAAVEAAAEQLSVHGIDDVRGNLTLPTDGGNGVAVTWASANDAVIDASGVVHRPAHGEAATDVELTATLTKGAASTEKAFAAHVPALPEQVEPEAYFFSYFTADTIAGEKIYFGASNGNNAQDWLTLNGGQPVIASSQGTKGLRDPFIIRSPEGDKFYMIATDLSIGGGTSWDASQRSGSKYLEVWESTDLVNWGEQRHVKVSPDAAGNTWAPEAYYDETIGAYVVFWASKLYAENDPNHTGSTHNRMLYTTTRDFRTFTAPQVWQDTGVSRIDSTVIKVGDTYHRFTKDEASVTGCLDILEETSTHLRAVTTTTSPTGTWALQDTCIGKKAGTGGIEGPSVFAANPGDVNGPGYYLFVDEFGGRKYIPLASDELGANADWKIPASYQLPSPAPRHGTVLPVSAEEYQRVLDAYLPDATSADTVRLTTQVGTEATLPAKVTVNFAGGSTQQLAVTWNEPPAGYADTVGEVEVQGTVAGFGLTATAVIRVTAAAGDLRLHYDFSLTEGTRVPDSSPYGNDGVIRGTGATVAGDVLTLPGGSASSGAGYVQLPTGLFDGRDTLTISTWLKNETASGNYAAMFFGTTQNLPTQYWLLNPRNTQGRFKSVITNGSNASTPWSTEYGISPTNAGNGIAGPLTNNDWGLYTTVIEPGKITGYYNGQRIGSVATTRTVSQFGSNLVAYLGKSSYADPFYKGGIRDVKVYTTALSASDINAEYYAGVDSSVVDAALSADAAAISVGVTTVINDLDLATTGSRGSSITWESSNPDVIAPDGTVTRPIAEEPIPVTLTATLTLAGRTLQRTFELSVLPLSPAVDLSFEADRYVVRPLVASGTPLPVAADGYRVAFAEASDGFDLADGAIVATGDAAATGTVTMTIGFTDPTITTESTKEFTVTVLPASQTRYVMSYEREPLATAVYSSKLAHSMHLAVGASPGAVTALNDNYGILFAKAQPTSTLDVRSTRTLRDPYIFRLVDGSYGVVATRALGDGSDDAAAAGSLLLFTSPDLTSFTEHERIALGTSGAVNEPRAVWDSAAATYRLTWIDDAGAAFHTRIDDLADSSTRGDIRSGALTLDDPTVQTAIPGARPSNVVPVSTEAATVLEHRYGRIANTSVQVDDAVVELGGEFSADSLDAALGYSDGSAAVRDIDWNAADAAAIDTSVPGEYLLRGTVRQRTYANPFISAEADPAIIEYDGGYLYISTDDANVINARNMYLRQADTIAGLRTAADHAIAKIDVSDIKGCFWAPEFHVIDGTLSVFFAPCIGQASWNRVQAHVMQLEGTDPTRAEDWGTPRPVLQADGSPLQLDAAHPGISLDMTHFEQGGVHYVAWSQRYITSATGDAEIWIATIDPADPWRLASKPVKLVTSEYGWDMNTSNVAEGPFFVEHGGSVFMTYSGSNVDATYVLGLLEAPAGSDLTDPAVWTKFNSPVLKSNADLNELGPGHNSFTHDEDGNLVLVYHAKTSASSLRDTFLRRVHWAADGRPVLDMTAAEEVAPANRSVSITVTVEGDGTITAPATPARPTTTLDVRDLTVAWVAPANGGAAIDAFRVQLYRGGEPVDAVSVDGSTTSVTFANLIEGAYTATVTAVNAVGASSESPHSSTAQVGNRLLAHYDFSAVTGALATGTSVPDAAGDFDATIRGNGATAAGGVLTLPGGSATSGAAYVQLPTGMFDGRDTVTISTWLKNETAAGNYAAMFFGTTQNLPSQYWLLNPRNPQGRFKSVITNGLSTSAPWGTEYGISPTTAANGIQGPLTSSDWGLYTTAIEPGKLTAYFNGELIGSVATTRTVSQFGDDLVAYIGKSSYADPFYKGGVRDVKVYTSALNGAAIAGEYYAGVGDPAVVRTAVDADAAALDLGPDVIAADLDLPANGERGSAITWSSSDAGVIAPDGTVNRPATDDASVTLTATLTLAGQTATREFVFTVLADTPQKDLDLVAHRFDLGITHVADDLVLRSGVGNVEIRWSSSAPEVVAADGTVRRQVDARQVTLTAEFVRDGLISVRTFELTVLAEERGRVGGFIRTGDTTRTDVLHLGASAEGIAYDALNNGRGVLYPTLGAAKFGAPTHFRHPDGSFGLVATENGAGSRIYVYDSVDLIAYSNERLVRFTSTAHSAARVGVAYDNGIGAYRLTYTNTVDGLAYEVTTTDFVTFATPQRVGEVPPAEAGSFPTGALDTSSIGVTAAEYERVVTKLGRVTSTGVRAFDDVSLEAGAAFELPGTATVDYSSGSTATMPVEWDADDLAAIDTSKPGEYLVDGTVQRREFADPLIERRADPDVTIGDDGWYYFTASYPMTRSSDPEGYDRVILRRAQTIDALATAPEVTIWHENTDPALNRYIWAPELAKIGDDWYILFTAARTGGVWDIRPAMLKFTGAEFSGDAALDPANWTSLGGVKAAAGDPIAFRSFSLDMTHFESGGKHYVIWAENPGPSTLRMAEIDPSDPSQLISPSIQLSTPSFAWEKNAGLSIDEGPAVIQKDGKIFVAFSAATVDDKYCVGLLTAVAGADLMNPASWTKTGYPLLTSDDVPGQAGPGHNSFTVDEYGNPVIVFHSRTVGDTSNPGEATDGGLYDPRRHARAALVTWDVDGAPVFAQTAQERLADAHAAVQVRVVVNAPEVPEVTATVDPVEPTGTNGWYTGPVTIGLALGEGPEATIEARVDGGDWAAYDTPITLDVDGAHRIEYRAVVAGVPVEESAGAVDVRIDRTAPTLDRTLTPSSGIGWTDKPVTAGLTATDAASGLDRIEYRLDGGTWQSTGDTLVFDEVGAHDVEVRAVDAAGNVGAADAFMVDVGPADLAVKAPGKGHLSSDNGHDTGLLDGDYRITMNLWWGENASRFTLYENGVEIGSQWLTAHSPDAQRAWVDVTGRTNGTYVYTGVLTNSKGSTETKSLTVKVRDANPSVPVLSHDNRDRDGDYNVTAKLSWGTNATSYRFFENGVEVASGPLAAATPGAQSAVLPVSGKARGSYEYTVEFRNAAGATTSKPITVTVAK